MKKSKNLNHFAKISLMYLGICLIGMIILHMGILIKPGYSVSYLDAFFTSVSSFATTGLTVFDVSQVYNYLGWFVLIVFFNIGGMGIMTLNTILFLLIGKKIGVKTRMLAQIDQNNINLEDMVTILRTIIKLFIVVELIGTLLIFLKIGYMDMDIIPRLMNSLFMASSAISGSGFYNTILYKNDTFVLIVLIFLMIFSFIGYPVLIDLKSYIKHKQKKFKTKFNFSSFTKIVVKVNIITLLLFAFIFFILEFNNALSGADMSDKILYSLFISTSTKSVGLNVFSTINTFMPLTLLFSTIFMIIGGSPSSACGGIRVSTVYVIFAYIRAEFRGESNARFTNYYIGHKTVIKAFFIVFMFLFTAFIGFFLIAITSTNVNLFDLWYDVISAITTTGFSTGALEEIGNFGIFIMAILMLIGRLGIMNITNSFHNKDKKFDRVKYVEKEIIL